MLLNRGMRFIMLYDPEPQTLVRFCLTALEKAPRQKLEQKARVEGYMVHLPLYTVLMNAGPSTDCCSARSLCLLLMTTTMMMMTTMITTTITSRTPRAAPTPASSGVWSGWDCVGGWKYESDQSTSSLARLGVSSISYHRIEMFYACSVYTM